MQLFSKEYKIKSHCTEWNFLSDDMISYFSKKLLFVKNEDAYSALYISRFLHFPLTQFLYDITRKFKETDSLATSMKRQLNSIIISINHCKVYFSITQFKMLLQLVIEFQCYPLSQFWQHFWKFSIRSKKVFILLKNSTVKLRLKTLNLSEGWSWIG